MGTWGLGPFESDSAHDVLCDILMFVEERIGNEIQSIISIGVLEPSGLASLHCLLALLREIPEARHILDRTKVDNWKAGLLAWRNKYREDMTAAGYSIEQIDKDIDNIFREIKALISHGPSPEAVT